MLFCLTMVMLAKTAQRNQESPLLRSVANMLVEAGATRLLTLDLHTVQVQGFLISQ